MPLISSSTWVVEVGKPGEPVSELICFSLVLGSVCVVVGVFAIGLVIG